MAKYPGMKIVEKQVGNFQRERGLDLMNNWLTAGTKIDAVAANNDEMAIGAIMAIQQAGIPPGRSSSAAWTPRPMRSQSWRKARWR